MPHTTYNEGDFHSNEEIAARSRAGGFDNDDYEGFQTPRSEFSTASQPEPSAQPAPVVEAPSATTAPVVTNNEHVAPTPQAETIAESVIDPVLKMASADTRREKIRKDFDAADATWKETLKRVYDDGTFPEEARRQRKELIESGKATAAHIDRIAYLKTIEDTPSIQRNAAHEVCKAFIAVQEAAKAYLELLIEKFDEQHAAVIEAETKFFKQFGLKHEATTASKRVEAARAEAQRQLDNIAHHEANRMHDPSFAAVTCYRTLLKRYL